jgi:predicted flap endonuclease-1-like 5' DNA nuclease
MTKLIEIEGIGEAYAAKLQAGEVKSLEGLLEKGSTKQGRKALEEATGITGKLILRWVNMADLFRIKGIGEEYADLLEAAGVDTVPELAQRKAENLHAKMKEVNEAKKLVRALPGLSVVESWVAHAKELPRTVTY